MNLIGNTDLYSNIEYNGFIYDLLMREPISRHNDFERCMHVFLNSHLTKKRKIIENLKLNKSCFNNDTLSKNSTPDLDYILNKILKRSDEIVILCNFRKTMIKAKNVTLRNTTIILFQM